MNRQEKYFGDIVRQPISCEPLEKEDLQAEVERLLMIDETNDYKPILKRPLKKGHRRRLKAICREMGINYDEA